VYFVLATGKCRESHGEELRDACFSPHVWVIRSRITMGAVRVAHMGGGGERCIHRFGGETRGKTLEGLFLNVRIILKWIFKK